MSGTTCSVLRTVKSNLACCPLARIASVSTPCGHVFGEEVLKGIRSFLVQWVWAGRWKHLLILKFLVLTGWKRNLHQRLWWNSCFVNANDLATQSCPCVVNGLKCTDICALSNRENQVKADDEMEVGSSDVDDDPEEE